MLAKKRHKYDNNFRLSKNSTFGKLGRALLGVCVVLWVILSAIYGTRRYDLHGSRSTKKTTFFYSFTAIAGRKSYIFLGVNIRAA